MRELGVVHDGFTFPIINRAVLLMRSGVTHGQMIHCNATKMGFGLDLYFCNTMIELYCNYGCVVYGRKMFDEMLVRDVVSWTSMIRGYASRGSVDVAFLFFSKMRTENMEPNFVTVIVMLQGCSTFGGVIQGKSMHNYVIKDGFLSDCSVQNSMLTMYTKLGSVGEVETFFGDTGKRDPITWTVLINFYCFRGDIEKVVDRFKEMQAEVELSVETLTLVISAFAKTGDLLQGEKLHCFATKVGLCDEVFQTSMLDFYAKCGELRHSKRLFSEIPQGNSITWSALMSGFVQNGHFSEAIALFEQMQAAGLKPRTAILRCLIDAYTNLGALQLGKSVQAYLIRTVICRTGEDNVQLHTSILNMYTRCGSIRSARLCFNHMTIKDMVTWTSMIEGYGIHGLGCEALNTFHQMVKEGMTPNDVTFLSLLSACSHSGLVSEGCEVYNSMKLRYGIAPSLDHHTCLVDLLGRCGKLKEALSMIMKLAFNPDSRIWGALLAASRVYGDRKVGKYAAQRLLELDPDDVGYHTLLGNIQASSENWTEVEEVRSVMNEKDMKKTPGWSYIEEKGRIHGFVSGDMSHPQVGEIYEVLGSLNRKIKQLG
ncbi:pentatricopeptide repeat-containing protein [Tripterygium wilfordii]|uniref:Pentatricopeptide repeat-containing protein n=2 Tax=Tripterygium wilfordii TaxID=458696 RepID=A0A7J7DVD4_TRIWF|nr:pentatricopeptide repeat-containing protein [Tripterygium wilfordii]